MCTEEVEMAAQFVNDNRSSLLPLLAIKQNFLQTELTGIWLPFAFLVAYPSLSFSSPELNIKDVFKDMAVFGHRNAFFSQNGAREKKPGKKNKEGNKQLN
jgi:hypothetical protein